MKKVRLFFYFIVFFIFTSCGYEPIHLKNANTNKELLSISVQNIKNRPGQILRNTLLNQLNPERERVITKYKLIVEIFESKSSLAYRRDKSATRTDLQITANYLLTDIKNGEIISLNNFPDFNPNRINLSSMEGRFNRALQANYEMGSTFKPIIVALGIDENIINKEMMFDVSKPINSIRDYHPFVGSLSVKDIVVQSSNIGAAKIAHKIGKKKQIEFFRKMGFFEKINIQIKEAAQPLGNKNNWGELETMTIGFGHGFAVTPLHIATAYASILNEGRRVIPTILLGANNISSEALVKKETSEYILELLRAVVTETKYTGPRVRIEGYEIGGKTGTAELINNLGQYQKDANLTSFIGIFPISKPQYLVLTIVENPKKIKEENYNITGAAVNAPLVKNIILRMIEILKIPRLPALEILNAAIRINYHRYYVT